MSKRSNLLLTNVWIHNWMFSRSLSFEAFENTQQLWFAEEEGCDRSHKGDDCQDREV